MTDAGWRDVCGIDEVGRGSLAGPVLACALVFHSEPPEGIRDSKTISASRRKALDILIRERAHVSIAVSEAAQIDEINILRATLDAMRRAHAGLGIRTSSVLIDGNQKPPIDHPGLRTLIRGDSLSISISAASIVAKVARDSIMSALHSEHPHYGWDRNAGYGSAEHLRGLAEHGHTRHHRMTFGPLKQPTLPL